MAYEAFDGGIDPGGLRDTNEIKILICYLLKTVDRPLSFDNLNEIVQKNGLVNYFEFAQSMHELLVSGHIDLVRKEEAEFYKVTRLGAGTADMFERRLPLSIREKAMKSAIRLLAKIKRESENKVEIAPNQKGGFTVDCSVLDQGDELMGIRLLVPEKAQAESIKRQFLSDPEIVYKGALALLTGDIKAVGGLIARNEENE